MTSGVCDVSIDSDSENMTKYIAGKLAIKCKAGDCILLKGDLGAGKTTFARGFIQALTTQEEEVLSPTFSIVQSYKTKEHGEVWHFDLYRLKSSDELQEIGFEDALAGGISLVEWPELIEKDVSSHALQVNITSGDAPDSRCLNFTSRNERWHKYLELIKQEQNQQ